MSEFCEHETFKDICGICHRDTQITALRAEVERLTGERDRQYDQNAEQIIRIAALEADNEKLRAALEMFACDCVENDLCKLPHACRNYVARAALEGKP